MKNTTLLFLLIISFLFSACSDTSINDANQQNDKLVVTYGVISNSPEDGFRRRELTIDSTDLTYNLLESFDDNSSETLKDTISLSRWKTVRDSIDFEAFSKLDSVVATLYPYATTVWIRIEQGKHSKKVSFHFIDESKFPTTLKTVINVIGPIHAKFPQQ